MVNFRYGIQMATDAIEALGKKREADRELAQAQADREMARRLYVDPDAPFREQPKLPPGASYGSNVLEAFRRSGDSLPAKLAWFVSVMAPGQRMDYKIHPDGTEVDRIEWGRAGNYNYGLVGTALGLSPELLHQGAGAAQIMAGNWKPSFGTPLDKGGSRGDDPWDKVWVDAGIRAQQRRGRWAD